VPSRLALLQRWATVQRRQPLLHSGRSATSKRLEIIGFSSKFPALNSISIKPLLKVNILNFYDVREFFITQCNRYLPNQGLGFPLVLASTITARELDR